MCLFIKLQLIKNLLIHFLNNLVINSLFIINNPLLSDVTSSFIQPQVTSTCCPLLDISRIVDAKTTVFFISKQILRTKSHENWNISCSHDIRDWVERERERKAKEFSFKLLQIKRKAARNGNWIFLFTKNKLAKVEISSIFYFFLWWMQLFSSPMELMGKET